MKWKIVFLLIGILIIPSLIFVVADVLDSGKDTSINISYTPYSKTVCNSKTCNLVMFSDIKYVYEDNNWKDIKDARSLLNSGIYVEYLTEDLSFPVKVIDYNYTSITIELSKTTYVNTDIPIKVLALNMTKNKSSSVGKFNKEDYDVKNAGVIKFDSKTNTLQKTYDFTLNSVLEFGYNSTYLKLTTGNSTADVQYDTIVGGNLYLGTLSKWNLSFIPSSVIINNVNWCGEIYSTNMGGGGDGDIKIWRFTNQTWNELISTSVIGNGTYTNETTTTTSSVTIGEVSCFNATNVVKTDYNLGNGFSTIRFEDPDAANNLGAMNSVTDNSDLAMGSAAFGGQALIFCDRENTGGCTTPPYLNITYDAITLYNLTIINPTTSNKLNVTSGNNYSIYFNFTNNGVNITSGVSLDSVFIGGINSTVVSDGPVVNTAKVYSANVIHYNITQSSATALPPTWAYGWAIGTNATEYNAIYNTTALDMINYTLKSSATDRELIARLNFTITEPIDTITSINITGAYSNPNSGGTGEMANMYIANWSGSNWIAVGAATRVTRTVKTVTYSNSVDINNIIRNGQIVVLFEADDADANEKLNIDWANITVYSSTGGHRNFSYVANVGWQVNVTAPTFESGLKDLFINATYGGNTKNDTQTNSINYGSDESDSCTYTSGDWNVLFSDYCNITSSVVGDGSNLVISGTGVFTTSSNITGFTNITFIGTSGQQSYVYCINGGCFI